MYTMPVVGNFGKVFNPWRMCEGYSNHFVCLSVYLLPRLYIKNKVPLSFLWRSLDMYCVDFIEITLFKSSGDIC